MQINPPHPGESNSHHSGFFFFFSNPKWGNQIRKYPKLKFSHISNFIFISRQESEKKKKKEKEGE